MIRQSAIDFDPRTKIWLLLICTTAALLAPSLAFEMLLVMMIAFFGILCGQLRKAILGTIGYFLLCVLTALMTKGSGSFQVALLAFMGLIHKVYPCGLLSGIILAVTPISAFIAALYAMHLPKQGVISLAVMLRYLPSVKEDWHYIKDAMRLRDISPSFKGLVSSPLMSMSCIYVPLMMTASKTADELTIASITRGIENPQKRTSIYELRFKKSDLFVISGFVLVLVIGGVLL